MTTEHEREANADETEVLPREREQAEEQDFALRNIAMTNALPNTPQPGVGAVIGSERSLGLEPETDEERSDDAEDEAPDRSA